MTFPHLSPDLLPPPDLFNKQISSNCLEREAKGTGGDGSWVVGSLLSCHAMPDSRSDTLGAGRPWW